MSRFESPRICNSRWRRSNSSSSIFPASSPTGLHFPDSWLPKNSGQFGTCSLDMCVPFGGRCNQAIDRLPMNSVLIVDSSPIVLEGCRRILEDAGFEPVLSARDIVAGYQLYLEQRPDVVIVDLAFAGNDLDGLALIRRIRAHDARTRILVLSMHDNPMIVMHSLEAGASSYVLKDTSVEELVRQVRAERRSSARSSV
jgi:CheY-like chemotaxis protein